MESLNLISFEIINVRRIMVDHVPVIEVKKKLKFLEAIIFRKGRYKLPFYYILSVDSLSEKLSFLKTLI